MATGDPLPRLADALREVGDRIHQISAELLTLESTAEGGARPAATPATGPVVDTGTGPAAPVSGSGVRPGAVPPAGAPGVAASGPGAPSRAGLPSRPQLPPPQFQPLVPSRWERTTRDGSRVLAWVGGIVTLAGVVLLLVLAIQQGYLGPLPRMLLGAGLGLALAGIGTRLHRNPHARTGAFALVATGFAVLYLDVVAATALFGYLPAAAGLGAGLGVAGLGLALAVRWDAQGLAVFVVLGAACAAPFVTGGFVPLLVGFLLVLEIGATPAQLARRWGGLALASGVPPVVASLVSIGVGQQSDASVVAYLALLTTGAQVVVATIGALRRPRDLRPVGLVLLAPAPAMFAASLLPQAGAIALPGTAGALLVLVWALGRLTDVTLPPAFAHAAGAAGMVALLQATVIAFDGATLAIVLLAQALLLALAARAMRYPHALAAASLFALTGLYAAAAGPLPGAFVASPPAGRLPTGTTVTAGLTGLLLAAAVLAICWVATRLRTLTDDGARVGWLLGGLVVLYGETGAVLSAGLFLSPDRNGFLLGHVLVTVSWTAAALVLLLRGIDAVPLRVAGLSLVGAALVKLVLFDLSSLDGLARVAAFLVAGLLLLGAGTRYARLLSSRAPEVTEGR